MNPAAETLIRLAFFTGVLVAMTVAEMWFPRRGLVARKPQRWFSNLALVGVNNLVLTGINAAALRLIGPMTAVGTAFLARKAQWGLLNRVEWPEWLEVLLAVIVLDLAIYLQHVMFHAVPALWRLHMVHHADLDIDVTTGVRFHTVEIVLSTAIKIGVVLLLGPSALAVLIFEVLLNATSMFSHGNVALPERCDRALRLFVVTPDMHRVHHSVEPHETNSNFGFNLPWWDFLLGTYRAQPAAGHVGMTIGLKQFRDERTADRLPEMLALPLTGAVGEYPIGCRSGKNGKAGEPFSQDSVGPNCHK